MTPEEETALRQRINANLRDVYSGKFRREKEAKAKLKRNELEQASALDIQLGHDVLERRELNKYLNRLLRKSKLTQEEHGAAEELQHLIDKYDYGLSGYTRQEQARFVRLWNKSQKQRYKL